jgi:hypothetical protein
VLLSDIRSVTERDLAGNSPEQIALWWQAQAGNDFSSWDPSGQLRPGAPADWAASVVRPGSPVSCDPYRANTADAGYVGGGFLVGPDGRSYPLVEPYVVGPDGTRYNADVVPQSVNGVGTLHGQDPGWRTLGVVSGMTELGPKAGNPTKAFSALGALAGGPGPVTTAQPAWLESLRLNSSGYPTLADEPQGGVTSAGPPASGIRDAAPPHTQLVQDDLGRWTQADRAAVPAELPSRVRVGNGVALGENLFRGGVVLSHIDDSRVHAYQVSFQQNDDGRVRAVMNAYQVIDNTKLGGTSHDIVPTHVSVGPDGNLVKTPMVFRQPDHPVVS